MAEEVSYRPPTAEGLNPGQSMWDMWQTKWHWNMLLV